MEIAVRHVLSISNISSSPATSIKERAKAEILTDLAVLTYWNHILEHCPAMDSSDSDDLMCDKWVTIRGHSFASGWVKQY